MNPDHHGDRSPRLLYVATVASTVRQFLLPIAGALRAAGWHVDAAASGALDDPVLVDGFDGVHDVPLSRSLRNVRGLMRAERALERLVSSTQPDIVHVHTPIASWLTRIAVARGEGPDRPGVVYTAHGFHFHRGGRPVPNLLFLAAERIAGRWTDRLVVINDEDRVAARRHRIVAPDRLIVMPGIGVDTTWYSRAALDPGAPAAARRQLGIPDGASVLVTIGELNANKRQADSIAALARLDRRDVWLVLLGEGPERLRLERMAGALGLGDRVVFAGVIADPRPIVAASAALMLTSAREGLARSVMEALALEIPVVASSARGNSELVGEAGFILGVGDVDGYAAALDRLLGHAVDAAAMGARGRSRMIEGYDLTIVVQRHEALYEAMLADRDRRRGAGVRAAS
jgi:glycosyltransferase involved in cell wall biosynthesis